MVASVALAGAAQSGTYVADNYIGADAYGTASNSNPDVIGSTAYFQIDGMTISFEGSFLNVSIDTAFAGRGDDGLYTSATNPSNGIGYGDLFLAGNWLPDGNATDKYATDQASNGTLWTYGFSLDDRWMAESEKGTGTLYQLNSSVNDDNVKLSNEFITVNGYRHGQEVAVDTGSSTVAGLSNFGEWWLASGSVNFRIDLAGTDLMTSDDIALHWALTCANDVIEGEVMNGLETPIPAAVWLFGTAVAGLFGFTRRQKAAA